MKHRDLYLTAYDITDESRLRTALELNRRFATGGQKSVHEIYLSPAEKGDLIANMLTVLEETEDRFLLIPPRSVDEGADARPGDGAARSGVFLCGVGLR